MFIKSSDKTKTFKTQAYRPGLLIPVFSAQMLLISQQHQFFLTQLREYSGLSDEQHQALYVTFVEQFVEFVQVLPRRTNDPLCSLMNDSLMRGLTALHQFLLQHKEAAPLERYALFTAAVLIDVAATVVNQKIFITDGEGIFIKHWDPFLGPLTQQLLTEFYKIMPLSSYYQRTAVYITPLLARQIVGELGFCWLASDLKILTDWLEALQADVSGGSGRFVRILQLFKHKAEGAMALLPAVTVTLTESPATVQADAFFAWLKEGLATGQIKVNTREAFIHVTADGVFIEKSAFKQLIILQQFDHLFGLTKLCSVDYRYAQLFAELEGSRLLEGRAKQVRDGILIADPNLIFTRGNIPPVSAFVKTLPGTQKLQNLPDITTTPRQKPMPSH